MSKTYGKCELCFKETYDYIKTMYGKMWVCNVHAIEKDNNEINERSN